MKIGLEIPLHSTGDCGQCGEQARLFSSCVDGTAMLTLKCQHCGKRSVARFTFDGIESAYLVDRPPVQAVRRVETVDVPNVL